MKFAGTDHTREFIPVLVYSKLFKDSGKLPENDTFAYIEATIADNFDVNMPEYGDSFLPFLK
jgi:phosphopentomutase